EIFASPDGHGGMLAALSKSGCLEDMKKRGIRYVFYGQVDNPLIQACDPTLIGYHILRQSEMTSQVVRKNDPLQKVGNVVSVNGKVQIIEYSDLPESHARQTNDDGSLKLWAGSIAVHVFDVSFLDRCNASADSLPFHRANKKVAFLNDAGELVKPDAPNAIKFEKFIFDLLPLANNAIICEVDPAEGFCAVKNAPPAASETPEHVRNAISDLHAGWLKECGISVAEGVQVEINPLYAVDSKQLAEKGLTTEKITKDQYFV
ncbi:MAG: UTP--glucose-1-phosphate uridylyltransferase, partial [Planctomycetota bacterium]